MAKLVPLKSVQQCQNSLPWHLPQKAFTSNPGGRYTLKVRNAKNSFNECVFTVHSYTLDKGNKLNKQRRIYLSSIYVLCVRGKDEDKRDLALWFLTLNIYLGNFCF